MGWGGVGWGGVGWGGVGWGRVGWGGVGWGGVGWGGVEDSRLWVFVKKVLHYCKEASGLKACRLVRTSQLRVAERST